MSYLTVFTKNQLLRIKEIVIASRIPPRHPEASRLRGFEASSCWKNRKIMKAGKGERWKEGNKERRKEGKRERATEAKRGKEGGTGERNKEGTM